jgi:hypothetical protein
MTTTYQSSLPPSRLPLQNDTAPSAVTSSTFGEFGGSGDSMPTPRILAVLGNCVTAAQKVSTELGLSPEEAADATTNLLVELERRLPQFVTVVCVISLLPLVGKRAFCHFRTACTESYQDSEELSQSVVVKVLAALTGSWPRGNVGAWLQAIQQNVFQDHIRKCSRRRRGMERLERAVQGIRR